MFRGHDFPAPFILPSCFNYRTARGNHGFDEPKGLFKGVVNIVGELSLRLSCQPPMTTTVSLFWICNRRATLLETGCTDGLDTLRV